MSISTWAATTGDWDDAKFSRAWNGPYINPAVGSLALSTSVPISTSGIMRPVGNASLAFTGQVPISTTGYYISVDNGTLTLSGQVPVSMSGHIISPAKGDLTGLSLGDAGDWDDSSSTWATISGNWGGGTLAPIAGVTYNFTIDSAGNLVLTTYDPDWRLIGDPKFIPSILIS